MYKLLTKQWLINVVFCNYFRSVHPGKQQIPTIILVLFEVFICAFFTPIFCLFLSLFSISLSLSSSFSLSLWKKIYKYYIILIVFIFLIYIITFFYILRVNLIFLLAAYIDFLRWHLKVIFFYFCDFCFAVPPLYNWHILRFSQCHSLWIDFYISNVSLLSKSSIFLFIWLNKFCQYILIKYKYILELISF